MSALETKLAAAQKAARLQLVLGLSIALVVLTVVAPLWYFGNSTSFHVTPERAEDSLSVRISDSIGVSWLSAAYFLGDEATLEFEAPGYIGQTVAVRRGSPPLQVAMQLAPVGVHITTEPVLEQAEWLLNGLDTTLAPEFEQELLPGTYELSLDPRFYRAEELQLQLEIGRDYAHRLELQPVTGSLDIRSEPPGARVSIEGETRGSTPLQIAEMAGGNYRLRVELDGYAPIVETIAVTHSNLDVQRDYRLLPPQVKLQVQPAPDGGSLYLNGVPVDLLDPLPVPIGKKLLLIYEKPGYVGQTRTLVVSQNTTVPFNLEMAMGTVVIRSTPQAEVSINGQIVGNTPQTLQLQSLPQKVQLVREGYRTLKATVTPLLEQVITIDEQLKTEFEARLAEAPEIVVFAGIEMKLFIPADGKNRFTMGSKRREKHRRANEFERKVALTKPFYVSTHEITQEQYATYAPQTVMGANLPMRNLSWGDAARFCNWLSERAGLQPAYQFDNGRLQGFDPTSDGFRLLSEAEWEWLARMAERDKPVRFVWGNAEKIPEMGGNFADESAKGALAKFIRDYRDGFAEIAPVGSFDADIAGLYDMAGNVSEWVHDLYALQPPKKGKEAVNPFGARYGDGHLIKGASFRSGSIGRLRPAYREGLFKGRDDVGFRVARYLYGKDE